ncbi:MAG: PEP/pyruvate-binding domain-containing protein [Desulfomonilaceae bacterium]|nr:PEP/pyruvate-binding domain-containing protein [Desulfomonilaceae bacterium]
MRRILHWIKRLVHNEAAREESEARLENLRLAFKARYQNFKAILSSNTKALDVMSEMEMALSGARPFGMSFVRSASTVVSVNVFRMIQHLDQMVPGVYSELFQSFEKIQQRLDTILIPRRIEPGDKLVVPLSAVDRTMVDQVGNKMANVAEIRNHIGLPVPPGFVVTAAAYEVFIRHNDLHAEIEGRIRSTDTASMKSLDDLSVELQKIITNAPIPQELEEALTNAYNDLESAAGKGVRVSLRSSALGEDALGASFAGQFRTKLNVSQADIAQGYKEIVASKYGLPAVTYRLSRGIPDESVAMCVGCMAMVNAVSGGVMYSVNPTNIRDVSVVINSVKGLPKGVVDGSVDPDVFVVSRTDPMKVLEKKRCRSAEQEQVITAERMIVSDRDVPKEGEASLEDDQAIELASMAIRLEEYYGCPQDIEWAVTETGALQILQCRPLEGPRDAASRGSEAADSPVDAPILLKGGVTASPGVAFGEVFVVRTSEDRLRFPQGAVLVTSQALPEWAPLLSRAGAVVTEVGGIAGHLANVAREFGVPALFGVAGAVEQLRQGALVTVDSDGRTVYEGRAEGLAALTTPRRNLMEGSPVYEALEKAASHIVTLNLLDPEAHEFQPKNCRTFHDITRYIHEKSVEEMFNFGEQHNFPQGSSKQLFFKVPMQWWVLNLEDGFGHEIQGKYVTLEDIVSVPMLAVWDGITAVPWEGSPQVDAKGFMSVMVQSAANPHIEASVGSSFSTRNLFLITKNYCSLHSRFGFHFSTLEAYVDANPEENYIHFAFKGGAADYRRRVMRARLIQEIMEEYRFRAEVKEDSLFGRMENADQEFMTSRLKILGYLILHTRQLDMVMSNEKEVARYKNKFRCDISTFLWPESGDRGSVSDRNSRSFG